MFFVNFAKFQKISFFIEHVAASGASLKKMWFKCGLNKSQPTMSSKLKIKLIHFSFG